MELLCINQSFSPLSVYHEFRTLSLKSHKAVINWKKTTGAVGYYIYRSTSANGKFSKIKAVARGNTLKYTDKSVKKNKKGTGKKR